MSGERLAAVLRARGGSSGLQGGRQDRGAGNQDDQRPHSAAVRVLLHGSVQAQRRGGLLLPEPGPDHQGREDRQHPVPGGDEQERQVPGAVSGQALGREGQQGCWVQDRTRIFCTPYHGQSALCHQVEGSDF